MRFLRDDRGQAIQVGAVLIFGVLVVFLALYQGFVVPNQNEEIEFNHNQQIQGELTDMRSDIISMPGETTTQSVSVGLGVRYPSRAVFVNPGPASGTLRTVGTTDAAVNLTIANATASGNLGDFWNDTAPLNTGAIEYRPSYNIFASAPRTVYENSVLYNDFGGNTTLPVTDQAMVSGSRLTLVALNGSFSQSRIGDTSLDLEPVSTDTRTIEIFNQSSPLTLTLPTRMNVTEWRTVFEQEMDTNGGNITAVNTTALPGSQEFSLLEVTLAPGTYSLRMAKVGVGTGVEETTEAYLTDVEGDGTTTQTGETKTLTLEVRDTFNKPIGGVTVNGSAENGNFAGPDSATVSEQTDENGQITVEYEAINTGNNDINFSIEAGYQPSAGGTHTADTRENVTMTVQVTDPPGGDGGGNGTSAFNVSWLDPSGEPGTSDCDDRSCVLNYSEAEQLNLTLNTTAQNAPVDFAVSNTTVGTLNTSSASTDADGEAPVTLQPQANGTVDVYGWTGGGGDSIEIEVQNYSSGSTPPPGGGGSAVFVSGGGTLKLGDTNGISTVGGTSATPEALGPLTSTFDSDSADKIPYVVGNELRLVDENGNNDELLVNPSGPNGVNPGNTKTLLAVGDWDGYPTSVYFADNSQERIYRHANGTTQGDAVEVVNPGNGVNSVLGIADIDGDSSDELVFEDASGELRYLEPNGGGPYSPTVITMPDDQIGSNNGVGVGRPADFDGDGQARIPIVNGSGAIILVNDTGSTESLTSTQAAAKSPIAPIDWDGDGNLEIVYVDKSTGEIWYIDDPGSSPTVEQTGNSETPKDETGIS